MSVLKGHFAFARFVFFRNGLFYHSTRCARLEGASRKQVEASIAIKNHQRQTSKCWPTPGKRKEDGQCCSHQVNGKENVQGYLRLLVGSQVEDDDSSSEVETLSDDDDDEDEGTWLEPSHGGGNLPAAVRRRLVPTVSTYESWTRTWRFPVDLRRNTFPDFISVSSARMTSAP